jgi:hypothetical protein
MSSVVLHIDSTFRDRIKYPNPCDFVVDPEKMYYSPNTEYINPIAIDSPNVHSGPDPTKSILGATPTAAVIGFPLGVTSTTTGSDDNAFANCTFMWRSAANTYSFTQISYADIDSPAVGSSTLLLYPPLPGFPLAGDRFNIYYNLPFTMGSLQAGSTTTQLVLSTTPYFSDPKTDEIKNMWLMITDTEDTFPSSVPTSILGQCYKVISYNSATRVATVQPNLAVAPGAGVSYEIYRTFKEGVGTLWFSGGVRDKFLTRCRNLTLTSLSLPNTILTNRGGGKIDRYSYITVRICNEGYSSPNNSTIATNSEYEHDATFIIPIYILLTTQRYFSISTNITKKLKLDFNRPIRITIRNPSGEIISFAADNPWISNLFPWFSSHIPANLSTIPAVEAVRYPGYSPESPPPFIPGPFQISLTLNLDCAPEN